jgi:signal transduction histidine kinase
MIEDTLDMSRLENNKFDLNFTTFDLREVINEVADIMGF